MAGDSKGYSEKGKIEFTLEDAKQLVILLNKLNLQCILGKKAKELLKRHAEIMIGIGDWLKI